jgi:hypothetical protein
LDYETANSKQQTANSKLYLILVFLLCFGGLIAQNGNQSLKLTNCFQTVDLDGGTKNIIPFVDYQFLQTGASFYDLVSIEAFDINGIQTTFNYDGLTEPPFQLWLNVPISTPPDPAIVHKDAVELYINGQNNTGKFSFGNDVDYIVITPLNVDESGNVFSTIPTTLQFTTLLEAITFESEQSCFTFDNFKLNLDNILDGFCGDYHFDLKKHWSDIADPNDPANVHEDLNIGVETDLINFDDHCAECLGMSAEPPSVNPDPVPCGCRTFEIDLTIEPCPAYLPEDCDDLHIFTQIDICCECDIRSSEPSTNPKK